MSYTVDTPRSTLEDGPMTRAQVLIIGLMVLLSSLDGYDLLSMALVAPAIGNAWAIGKATLGILLASSLLGMAAGSLGLSPLADLAGRKPAVLAGIGLMAAGTLLSALSQNVPELAASRVLTGLGIGLVVTLITSLAAEFASLRRRSLAIAATTMGLSIGSMAGGLTAAALLHHHGWPWVFLAGTLAASVLFPLVALYLPESPAFLVSRHPAGALGRLNRVLTQLGHPPVAAVPPGVPVRRTSYRALFAPGMAAATIRLTVVNALVVTAAYYMLSWLPLLVAGAGFPASTASLVSALSSLVGVVGGLGLGLLGGRVAPARLAAGAMVGMGVGLAAIGLVPPVLPAIILAVSVYGFCLSGCTGVYYATVASTFSPLMRASGIGFVMGVGRIFSILGPYVGGRLFAAGLTRAEVTLVFAAAAVAGGVLLASSARLHRPAALGGAETA